MFPGSERMLFTSIGRGPVGLESGSGRRTVDRAFSLSLFSRGPPLFAPDRLVEGVVSELVFYEF